MQIKKLKTTGKLVIKFGQIKKKRPVINVDEESDNEHSSVVYIFRKTC